MNQHRPNSGAKLGHPAEEHRQEHQDRAETPAPAGNGRQRANSATAKPTPGQDVRSASPRVDRGQWPDRGKACADQPCGRCPSQGNRSRATTTPAPAPSKYMRTSTAAVAQDSIQSAWRTSRSITSCSCSGTRLSTRPSRTITRFTDASATTAFPQTKREIHGQRTPC